MTKDEQLSNAFVRADLWRILALCFSTPTHQALSNLHELANDLASVFDKENDPLAPGLTEIAKSVKSLDPTALEHEYNALFSMDVMVPAYEGSYQRIERGAIVGDVAGYYKAFGLETSDHSGPPDSLWNELAFMSWLSLKEAYALENELEEALTVTRAAMSEFLQDHLGRWTGAFTTRLCATTGNPLYVNAAHLLLATVSRVADELQIEKILPIEVRELPEEPDAVACPVGGQSQEGPGAATPQPK